MKNGEIIKVKISSRYTIKIEEETITATDLRWKIPVLSFLPNDMSIIEGSSVFSKEADGHGPYTDRAGICH